MLGYGPVLVEESSAAGNDILHRPDFGDDLELPVVLKVASDLVEENLVH
jgi:hypothetical protein